MATREERRGVDDNKAMEVRLQAQCCERGGNADQRVAISFPILSAYPCQPPRPVVRLEARANGLTVA